MSDAAAGFGAGAGAAPAARPTRITRVERLAVILAGPDGGDRPFAAAVETTVEAPVDPATGMVMNLVDLKAIVREALVEPLDGHRLDGRDGRPRVAGPEDLLREARRRLVPRFRPARLVRVALDARPAGVLATGGEENDPMDVTRIYEFSAAHRLHAPALSDEENRRVFGKCNRPNGHGHNYVLEVTVRGASDPGREVLAAEAFDRVVHGLVVDAWDHRHLNLDVPEFSDVNPTAEEIARVAFETLAAPLAEAGEGRARLARVVLHETARNRAEYPGGEGA